jgi:NTE family protein
LNQSLRRTLLVRVAIASACLAALAIAAATWRAVPDFPNRPLADGAANPPQADSIGTDPDAPLIMMMISGGGSRAAAVGLGVLEELAAVTYTVAGRDVRLINQVKAISSVSGGSVLAAWFGLVGPERLEQLKDDFLARDNMARLEHEAANPLTWARLSFTGYTRTAALRDLLDEALFHGARFADLRRPGAPLIVINATDMASGEIFAFTPQRFNDICSDLDQMPISVGVSASAAFPIVLSPVSLRNYSYEDCKGATPGGGWSTAELTLPLPRYLNPREYKRARYANALRNGLNAYQNEHYLHLLDGGLTDNQGIQSLIEALVSPHSPARILEGINAGRARRIVMILVKAGYTMDNGIGSQPAVPGLLNVVNTVIGAPIASITARADDSLQDLVDTLNAAGASPIRASGKPLFASLHVYSISLNFDQFLAEQRLLQRDVNHISTSWSLSSTQLQEAIDAGKLLLRQHPCFQRLIVDLKATPTLGDPDLARESCPYVDDRYGDDEPIPKPKKQPPSKGLVQKGKTRP